MSSSKNILGPYLIQATIPNLQSEGYEDPVVWCSGGQYHLVANMYNARKAHHFTSVDGVHNWTDKGLAYDPTSDFVRYTDGTVDHWYKAERPGVYLENGHVTAFSFAVIDVDKTLDLASDSHGSKVIVVPFDGVGLDRDDPGPGSAACPADADAGAGDAGSVVVVPPGDAGATADASRIDASQSGSPEAGAAAADAAAASGVDATAGSPGSSSSGSADAAGGAPDLGDAAGPGASEDAAAPGMTSGSTGSTASVSGGGNSPSGGCSCRSAGTRPPSGALGALVVALLAFARRRPRGGHRGRARVGSIGPGEASRR